MLVQVTDHSGAPAIGAEVCLVVVDESVLALSGYALSDPLNTFYPARPNESPSKRFANRKDVAVEVLVVTRTPSTLSSSSSSHFSSSSTHVSHLRSTDAAMGQPPVAAAGPVP